MAFRKRTSPPGKLSSFQVSADPPDRSLGDGVEDRHVQLTLYRWAEAYPQITSRRMHGSTSRR